MPRIEQCGGMEINCGKTVINPTNLVKGKNKVKTEQLLLLPLLIMKFQNDQDKLNSMAQLHKNIMLS